MSVILLAVFLIGTGLTRLIPALSTPTINVILAIIAIAAGILMLLGR